MVWTRLLLLALALALLLVLAATPVRATTIALVCPPDALPGWSEQIGGGIGGTFTCWASYAGAAPAVQVAGGALLRTQTWPGQDGGTLAVAVRAGEPGDMVVTVGELQAIVRVVDPWNGRGAWLPQVSR